MRAKFLQDIIDETPKDVAIFMRWYADLTIKINRLMKEKGISQKDLAESLGKKPSEISKWLKGEHNFTLRSLAKLEAELGEKLLEITASSSYQAVIQGKTKKSIQRHRKHSFSGNFSIQGVTTIKRPLSYVS